MLRILLEIKRQTTKNPMNSNTSCSHCNGYVKVWGPAGLPMAFLTGEKEGNVESLGQLGGASLSKCPRASCRGGVNAKLWSQPLRKDRFLSKENRLAENQIQRLLDASQLRVSARFDKAAVCRNAVGRVLRAQLPPTAQILQKNHSLSMRCQNSDPTPQLLKSAHTRGT